MATIVKRFGEVSDETLQLIEEKLSLVIDIGKDELEKCLCFVNEELNKRGIFKVGEESIEKIRGCWGSAAGKTYYAKEVIEKIPEHKTYIEPFAGGAAVFYMKEPSEVEVLSDTDKDVSFAFKFLRDATDEQIKRLKKRNWLVSKEQAQKVHDFKPITDEDRFYRFTYKRGAMFMRNIGRTTAIDPEKEGRDLTVVDRMQKAKERLKNVKVYNKSYEEVIKEYDGENSFFYLDPPYPSFAQEVGEKEFDEDKFIETLKSIKGKFFLHYEMQAKDKLEKISGFKVSVVERDRIPMFQSERKKTKILEVRNYEVKSKTEKEEDIEKQIWGSPMGKSYLAKRLVKYFPEHKTYVEPFAGSGKLLFTKEKSEIEVLNDADPEIAFAFKFASNITEKQISQLKMKNWTGSKKQFDLLKNSKPTSDIDRFYRFVYLTRFSFNSYRRGFKTSVEGFVSKFVDKLEKYSPRLKNVKVYGSDYEEVIKKYDGPDTFFFLDPPYSGYDADPHSGVDNKLWDEERFAKVIRTIKGKFICTYGIRGDKELFKGFNIQRWKHQSSVSRNQYSNFNKVPIATTIVVSNFELKSKTEKAVWTTAYINDLPDKAFLYIQPGGEIDEEGKTKPRTLRHWPIYDHNGNLDLPHLRNAIARITQTKVPLSSSELKEFQERARRLLEEAQKQDILEKVIETIEDGLSCDVSEEAVETTEELVSKSSERITLLKTKEERYVLGVVLEPNDGTGESDFDPDSQKDIYSKEEVRQTEQKFMEDFQNIGLMHRTLVNGKVKILESYISPIDFYIAPDGTAIHESEFDQKDGTYKGFSKEDFQVVKQGTWLLGLRIVDDMLWKEVQNGKLDGLSIGGSARRVAA